VARGYQDKDWSVIARVAAEDAGLPGSPSQTHIAHAD
jgi:hypothetical protein